MANVFRKLIQKEFGANCYFKFFIQYQEILYNNRGNEIPNNMSNVVYKDMYELAIEKNPKLIKQMQKRIENTIMNAFYISRLIIPNTLLYIIGIAIIFSVDISSGSLAMGMFSMSLLYAYKLVEFLSNKFCYIDARLFGVYKTVIDDISVKLSNTSFEEDDSNDKEGN